MYTDDKIPHELARRWTFGRVTVYWVCQAWAYNEFGMTQATLQVRNAAYKWVSVFVFAIYRFGISPSTSPQSARHLPDGRPKAFEKAKKNVRDGHSRRWQESL